jgi:hypothetical protein
MSACTLSSHERQEGVSGRATPSAARVLGRFRNDGDGGKVVAQAGDDARLADVVHVHVARGVEQHPGDLLAERHRVRAQRALLRALARGAHGAGGSAAPRESSPGTREPTRARFDAGLLRDEVHPEGVIRVRAVLDLGHRQAVADREAPEREGGSVSELLLAEDAVRDGGDVMPRVGFAGDEKVAPGEFGVRVGKLGEEL